MEVLRTTIFKKILLTTKGLLTRLTKDKTLKNKIKRAFKINFPHLTSSGI